MNIYQGMRLQDGVIVTCNGRILEPDVSLTVRNHSPAGFNWGYGGSGPAQLALAILLHECPIHVAVGLYQKFKEDVVSKWHADWFICTQGSIVDWISHQASLLLRAERNAPHLGMEFELVHEALPPRWQDLTIIDPDDGPR
jgi:hypothetical protein